MATVLAFERHPVRPSDTQPFEELLGEFLDTVRRQPGVLWADASRAFDDDPSYVVVSEWRTEGDLEAWEDSPAFRELSDRGEVHLRESPTRRRFTSKA